MVNHDIDFDKILYETKTILIEQLDKNSDKYPLNVGVISLSAKTCKTMLELYHQDLLANLEK